jgi:M6 family metalloprotease-like protein
MKAWVFLCLTLLPPTASCGGGSTTPSKPVLTTLAVTLDRTTIPVGQTATATAVGRDQSGNAIATGAINWTSSAQGVAMVNGAGVVQAIAQGQANISASVGAVSNFATITVTAPQSGPAATCILPARFTDLGLGFPRVANRQKTIGDVHITVLFVDFSDAVATRTPQNVFAILSPTAESYYKASSYGRMNLILEPSFVWRRMSKPTTGYGWSNLTFDAHRAYIQEALNLASSVDFSQSDGFIIVSNPDAGALTNGPAFVAPQGLGVTAGGKTFLNGATSGRDLTGWGGYWLNHEMGHTLGLPDLYAFSGQTHRFVGGFSLMGLISGHSREYFGWERRLLGWIDESQVTCAGTGTTNVTLTPIERTGGTKIVVAMTGTTTAVVAESRRAEGYDTNGSLTPGVLVYYIDTSIASGNGVLKVLPINDADVSKAGVTVQPGGSITFNGVTVSVVSRDPNGDLIRIVR